MYVRDEGSRAPIGSFSQQASRHLAKERCQAGPANDQGVSRQAQQPHQAWTQHHTATVM
jgi:hypothetical protein